MENEVTKAPVVMPVNQQVTPMQMISIAVSQGASVEQLQKLFELQVAYEKNEARKAFADAMVRFKAIDISIDRNKDVSFGNTKYSHATLDNVCRQIIKALQSVGISHSWKPETTDGKIKVSCILRHQLGHEEAVTLDAPPDNSGSKNAIQQIASTITYLERYSLLASTGLAVGIPDDDGSGSGKAGLPDDEYQAFAKEIEAQLTKAKAKAVWQRAVTVCAGLQDVESANKLKAVLVAHGKFIDAAAAKEAA